MNQAELDQGRLHNMLTRSRAVIAGVALAAGALIVGGNVDTAEAAIPGISTPAETNCNFLGRGVFRATSTLDTDVSGILVSVDNGSRIVLDSSFTIPANDETASVLPESAEDTDIIFEANDGRGATDPSRVNCIEDEEPTTTTTEPEPTTTSTTVLATTTTTGSPITTTTVRPATTTTSSTPPTTVAPATTTSSVPPASSSTTSSSSSSTTSTTALSSPTTVTTLDGGVGGGDVSQNPSTTVLDAKKGGQVLALTGENEGSMAAMAAVLLGLGAGALILERNLRRDAA